MAVTDSCLAAQFGAGVVLGAYVTAEVCIVGSARQLSRIVPDNAFFKLTAIRLDGGVVRS
jgi:hypothetical protein